MAAIIELILEETGWKVKFVEFKNKVQIFRKILRAAIYIHPGISLKAIKRKVLFVLRALNHMDSLSNFELRLSRQELSAVMADNADIFGVTEWPYLNNVWTVAERLDKIAAHYEYLASFSHRLLAVTASQPLHIASLSHLSSGCRIEIDRAPWFKREGQLVLNLFREDLRIVSIAFIFGIRMEVPTIYIGAIQGIHSGVSTEESLSIYKTLTKDFEGLRPRSLLLDVLKSFGSIFGVKAILAIADENRHHRHEYFGTREAQKLGTPYDQIWIEHGGVPSDVAGFFELPVFATRKPLSEIPSRKRAMYRRRYEILDSIDQELAIKLRCEVAEASKGKLTGLLPAK